MKNVEPVWKVQLFTDDGLRELSVVKIGTHGSHSWGWPGNDKIVLFDGQIGEEFDRKMYNFIEKYAYLMCAELNFKAGVRVKKNEYAS